MKPYCCYTVGILLMLSSALAKLIDLSHKHGPKVFMTIPGNPGYNLTNLYKGDYTGIYIELNYYGTSEHGGTHIDAPSHFIQGGLTLDDVPLEYTVAEGVVIDCKKEAAMNPGYAVPLQKILDWQAEHGDIPKDAAVLFSFGWYQKYDNEAQYRGTRDVKNVLAYIYPYVSVEVARWLIEHRNIRLIGADTLSPDPFQIDGRASGFPIHIMYLSQNRILVENLRDLDRLPARGFRFYASPVKFVGASGAQVRAFAMTHDGENSGHIVHMSAVLTICLAILQHYLL